MIRPFEEGLLMEQLYYGEEITAAPTEESKTQIIDLMAALKASLEEGEGDEERKPAERADRKAKKDSGKKKGKKAASG